MNILHHAAELVYGDRRSQYGPPSENHARTAALWNAYLSAKPQGYQLDGYDVCHFNMLQKISRDAHKRKDDNLIDISGFAENASLCVWEGERWPAPRSA